MPLSPQILKLLSTTPVYKSSRESNVTTSWGVEWDELYIARDILQNFYDANKLNVDQIDIKISDRNNVIITAPAEFNIEQLFYLGSQKTDDDVGQYGEGFKAACVCLLRDHNLTPVAITGNDIYHIRLSEEPVKNTDMYPMIYDYYTITDGIGGSKFILENCNPALVKAFELGLASFFFAENHPIIGDKLEGGWGDTKTSVYHSKDGEGYIYFENMMRARLGPKVPLVFSIEYSYKAIKKKIGLDRDRKTFGPTDDLSFFFNSIKLPYRLFRNALEATEESLWSLGHTHLFLECENRGWGGSNHESLFEGKYYVKSSSKDIIEHEQIRKIEQAWREEGLKPVAKIFLKMGATSALKELEAIRKKAHEESKNAAKRAPFGGEVEAINFMNLIMLRYSPDTTAIFTRDKCSYYVINSEALLGEFKSNRGYRERSIYLNEQLFTSSFAQMLTTFIHEHQHIYGSDGSPTFTYALTTLIEVFIEKRKELDKFEKTWNDIKARVAKEREEAGDGRPLTIQEKVAKMTEEELRDLLLKFPEASLRDRLGLSPVT